MSETGTGEAAATKAAKPKPEVTKVTLSDGRVVDFVGKRKMLKDATAGEDYAQVVFDFVSGATRTAKVVLGDKLLFRLAAHGLAQKVGDETAGEESVDDMVVAVDAMLERLAKGEWGTERKAGDGFSGASVVIKAIMEATRGSAKFPEGMALAQVKEFLEGKLKADATLTRQKLYQSFRAPGTKTAAIIERLEKEKAQAAPAINADAELEAAMN
jgi:hypothetical protein